MIDPSLSDQLISFQRKFFYNKLLRGSLIFIASMGGYSIFIIVFESLLRPESLIRGLLLICTIIFILTGLWTLIIRHFIALLKPKKYLTDEQAARLIGQKFDDINDRLVNTLQLKHLTGNKKGLAQASIDQRTLEFNQYTFDQSINLRLNSKYFFYAIAILFIIILLNLMQPGIYSDSSKRIINYNQIYENPLPFQFVLLSKNLEIFRNESFLLELALTGNEIPDLCYILIGDQQMRMKAHQNGQFSYLFETVPNDLTFSFFSAGYQSKPYYIVTKAKPELIDFNVQLTYPKHTHKEPDLIFNNGNLNIPEHTQVSWNVSCNDTDSVQFIIGDRLSILTNYMPDNQLYTANYKATRNEPYEIVLANKYGRNNESIKYKITVIKDLFPELKVDFLVDTLYYDFILITGNFSDDYGIKSLVIEKKGKSDTLIALPVRNIPRSQSFYHKIPITSEMLDQQERIELQVILTDNDKPNNYKSTFSAPFHLQMPDNEYFKTLLSKKSKSSENTIKELISRNKSIQEKLLDVEEKLKITKNLSWKDRSMFKEILEEKQQLERAIYELSQKMKELNQQENKFNDKDQVLQQKAAQLKTLISNILDDKTKKLFDELEKLLQENKSVQDIQKRLSKIKNKEKSIEQELNRALELFKRLKLENDIDQAHKTIEKLSQDQQKIYSETMNNELSLNEIKMRQNKISQDFKKFKQDINEIKSLNQELLRPEPLYPTKNSEKIIDESLKQINKALEKEERRKAYKEQKNAGNEMKNLSNALKNMQLNMQQKMLTENIEDLNKILDDLIKLSFKQEDIMISFRKLKSMNPKFISLSQKQLTLKNQVSILSDSLLALSKRVVAISSFVTGELSELNRNINASILALRQRKTNNAVVNQQYSMTSMNNLALLLNDLLQQMRNQANGSSGSDSQNQSSEILPNLRELQQQLSKQIQELKKGNLKGRELNQELAEMAARQEMIRNELNKFNDKLKGQPGNQSLSKTLKETAENMEKNELNLINKQITQELINRQKQILTRLLETDKALQNQNEDESRKAETAKDYNSRIPEALENYLKMKTQEIELLKSVPINLHPFYKSEVQKYFKRISEKKDD